MNIGLDIQNSIRRIDMYHFDDEEEKKKYVAELNALFAESRTRFHELRRIELENGNQLFDFPEPPHQNVRSQQQDEGAFQLVKGRKKGRSPTPPKDTATSLKSRKRRKSKHRINTTLFQLTMAKKTRTRPKCPFTTTPFDPLHPSPSTT
ncbi:hypothetical protein TNCV_3228601 [Trichonephila clavipes]|nr:hypothetical protein TNCV_3228601 [Trichonephila clavipes]